MWTSARSSSSSTATPTPSVFDRVVAIDAGADEVFSYGGVKPEQVRDLVHGAIFTRGPKDLKHTAFFIGGSDVAAGEKLLAEALRHMMPQFGLRVSVLLDANGANTTAAAAVRAAARHLDLKTAQGAGPGRHRPGRPARRPAAGPAGGARCASARASRRSRRQPVRRSGAGAGSAAGAGRHGHAGRGLQAALAGRTLVIAAGAAGVVLLPRTARTACPTLRVAIDLNAVPPLGIEGVEVMDKGQEQRRRDRATAPSASATPR